MYRFFDYYYFYLRHVSGQKELRIAAAAAAVADVVFLFLVGGRFLKCVPTLVRQLLNHTHVGHLTTHNSTQTK